MTATHVNGVAVVEDQPARASITDFNGDPVHFKQIRELLLADETVVYGCLHCDYTRDKPGQIRSHLKLHATPKAKTTTAVPKELTISDLLSAAAKIEKLTAERDEWKRRAVTAERELATVRKVLSGGARPRPGERRDR